MHAVHGCKPFVHILHIVVSVQCISVCVLVTWVTVQKWLNRPRCHLGGRLNVAQGSLLIVFLSPFKGALSNECLHSYASGAAHCSPAQHLQQTSAFATMRGDEK